MGVVDRTVLQRRLETLTEALQTLDFRSLRFGPIDYMKYHLTEGRLAGLAFADVPITGNAMAYTISQKVKRLHVSDRLVSAMQQVATNQALTQREADWMVDNFLLHELLHFAQGMGGGNHSNLRTQASRVLLAIDYQADALAIVTAAILCWQRPDFFGFDQASEQENHWTLYVEGIKATLRQMEIFTLLSRRDMNRETIAEGHLDPERFQRIATWHYQLHRSENFNAKRPLVDFQILSQPVLDFRYLRAVSVLKPSALNRRWPSNEQAIRAQLLASDPATQLPDFRERDLLILTGVSEYGTTRFVRFNPADPVVYANAFDAFFTGNTALSERFFTLLFESNRWLLGDTPPDNGGPQIEARPNGGPDPSGLALTALEPERQRLLEWMFGEPLQYAQTVMAH